MIATNAAVTHNCEISAVEYRGQRTDVPLWARFSQDVGRAAYELAEGGRRALVLVITPYRPCVAFWIALGAMVASARDSALKKTWESFSTAGPGSSHEIRMNRGARGAAKVLVRVLEVGDLPGMGRSVTCEVVRGPAALFGRHTFTWATWRATVVPVGTRVRRTDIDKLDAAGQFVRHLATNSDREWLLKSDPVVVVNTRIGAWLNVVNDTRLVAGEDVATVESKVFFDNQFGRIRAYPDIADGESLRRSLTINDGREFVRAVQADFQGVIVGVLSWAELTSDVENVVSPILAADSTSSGELRLSELVLPEAWDLIVAVMP